MQETYPRARRERRIVLPGVLLLLMVCLMALAGCSQPFSGSSQLVKSNTTNSGQPKSASLAASSGKSTTANGPVVLGNLHMFDQANGWAITHDKIHVLHTRAGLARWQDVTPESSSHDLIEGTFFLNPTNAWVARIASQLPATPAIFHTSDGGHSWQKALLPEQGLGVGSIVFVNAQTGWLLLGKGAGMNHEALDVLHTTNGGATWTVTTKADNTTENKPDSIPFSGDKSGFNFTTSGDGWITGTIPANDVTWLYSTHDGGATWKHQDIPLADKSSTVNTMPPVFFGSKDGILPVILNTSHDTLFNAYTTHDGGASWQPSTSVPGFAEALDFSDATHGWIANKDAVYSTSDGGQRWSRYPLRQGKDLAGVQQLNFVSPTTGWALMSFGSNDTPMLFQTQDGGQSWSQLQPALHP
ncbi:hypothetical protein EPA93_34995 [Ktedonosporobacter rubrisoli]|uniref:Photosynthesis system II assembly factor Ycf48/Hcf136-like domain-containing protein n=1 Tax=Ktedonosporobacter rubrisoli TaxID=2509675 RepID=A0A4P6JYK8_KTERU|nr:hypothetical protein [Ktedonosporobacter rubrisoli]QBD80898.1 hypothetical protein EPA93_34995 [Ktedonosporobacter rubrisoli]